MSLKHRSERAQAVKPKNALTSFLILAATVCIAIAIVWSTVTTNIEVENNQAKINTLNAQITDLKDENAQMERYLNNPDALKEYMEQQAREKFNYAYENEIVYYIVPSTDIEEVAASE